DHPASLDSFVLLFFTDTAPTQSYTLSLHDALPISPSHSHRRGGREGPPRARGPLRGRLEQPGSLPPRDRLEARGAARPLPEGRPELRRDRDLPADGRCDRAVARRGQAAHRGGAPGDRLPD